LDQYLQSLSLFFGIVALIRNIIVMFGVSMITRNVEVRYNSTALEK